MASITVDLLEAVTTYLISSTFSFPVTFRRDNFPLTHIEQITDPFTALVYPGERSFEKYLRQAYRRKFQVQVGVYAIGQNEMREDEVIQLGEEIEGILYGTTFFNIGPDFNQLDRTEEGETTFPPFVSDELERQGVVTVIVPATYMTITSVVSQVSLRKYLKDDDGNYVRDDDGNYVAAG